MRLTKVKTRRFQVLRRSDHGALPDQPDRRRGPERLRQVEHHRRGALGHGRTLGAPSARRLDGRRDLQRLGRAQARRQASVELIFDNSDGKIGGSYAGYNEISLKRVVSRDGTSAYFLNGARCRRKDITTLFLGTGLGSRSYAIIEQGMISRVIEARSEDMRAFIEEAAGISKYKERRHETETRISDTRENLERLHDLREEVDKQIRHLQRQAYAGAPVPGPEERRAPAHRRGARAAAARDRQWRGHQRSRHARQRPELQQALAAQRTAEAAVEKQREFQFAASERVNGVQADYYQQGAEVARAEQTRAHARAA